jgi:hypothetical protein
MEEDLPRLPLSQFLIAQLDQLVKVVARLGSLTGVLTVSAGLLVQRCFNDCKGRR